MTHELCLRFEAEDLALDRRLAEMLDEHFSHCTERRGCGLTQATRFLAERINQPRDPVHADDLGVFESPPAREAEVLGAAAVGAGWASGWRRLDLAPEPVRQMLASHRAFGRIERIGPRIAAIAGELEREESRLVLGLLRDLLDACAVVDVDAGPSLVSMEEKPGIGSCSAAEEYFLEIAHGRVRRVGEANVLVDEAGDPVLVEKMGLGESHSAMSVRVLCMNGVRLPPGSLFALERGEPDAVRRHTSGAVLPLGCVQRARFLRLTTLAVEPAVRARAFGRQLESQVQAGMFSPLTTTISNLREFAQRAIRT